MQQGLPVHHDVKLDVGLGIQPNAIDGGDQATQGPLIGAYHHVDHVLPLEGEPLRLRGLPGCPLGPLADVLLMLAWGNEEGPILLDGQKICRVSSMKSI